MNLTMWPALAVAVFAVQYRAYLRLHPSGTLGFVKYLLVVLLTTKLAQIGLSAAVPVVLGGFEMQLGSGGFEGEIGAFLVDFMATPPSPFIALFLIIMIELTAGESARVYLWMQASTREAVHSAAAQWWANLVVFVAVPFVVFGGIQLLMASTVVRVSASPSWGGGVFAGDYRSSQAKPIHIYDFVVPAMQVYGAPQRVLSGVAGRVGLIENRQAPQLEQQTTMRDVVSDAAPWFLLSALLPLFGFLSASTPRVATSRPKVRDLLIGTAFGAAASTGLASRLGRLPWRGKAVLAVGFGLGVLGVLSVLLQAVFAQMMTGISGVISGVAVLGAVVLFLILVGVVVLAQQLGRKK
jgi:hypothetical protein